MILLPNHVLSAHIETDAGVESLDVELFDRRREACPGQGCTHMCWARLHQLTTARRREGLKHAIWLPLVDAEQVRTLHAPTHQQPRKRRLVDGTLIKVEDTQERNARITSKRRRSGRCGECKL
eukprot:scaffold76062_cov36-Phaeocystis_antarctica.AAC.5